MTKIKVDLTSTIIQDDNSENFHQQAPGELTIQQGIIRVSYLEDEQIPVKMLIKGKEMIIRRGVDHSNYSQMRFVLGEKSACRYVVSGRQMDLTSVTNLFSARLDQSGKGKVRLEYDLFNGLYLVGNYAVTLIFA